MASDLKPCPFCGATTDQRVDISNGTVAAVGLCEVQAPDWHWYVRCKPCAFKCTSMATDVGAVEAWNRRATVAIGGRGVPVDELEDQLVSVLTGPDR